MKKREKTNKVTVLILLIIFLIPAVSMAVTGSVSPSTALPGQTITVNASWADDLGGCSVMADFLDGTVLTVPCTNSVSFGWGRTCSGSVQHSYSYPGYYPITVYTNNCSLDSPPDITLPVTINCPALNLLTQGQLPSGRKGQPYSLQLQTTGGTSPLAFTLTGSLPPGLNLNSSTGLISGTPASEGNYFFGVDVSDSCPFGSNSASGKYSLLINCAQLNISSPSTLPSATVGRAYNYQLQAQGGSPPYRWGLVAGSLPPGVSLSSTGLLTGTPQSQGTFRFAASVEDSCSSGRQVAQRTFALPISLNCPDIVFTMPASLPAGEEGKSYNYSITTSGGTPPLTFSISSGSLPPGLNLSSSGIISGIPSSSGTYNFTLRAVDSCPAGAKTRDINLALLIKPKPVKVTVTVSPPSFRIPRGSGGSQSLSYTALTNPPVNMELRSTEGIFLANGQEVGRINTPLQISVHNGSGRAIETITFPVSVLKRAEQLGVTRIKFRRTFTESTQTSTAAFRTMAASVVVVTESEMIVTTEAGAELRITRMQLYFGNRRAETTVKRNDPSLKAFVDIRFTGSGLLEGYWEVDGRILSHVKKHIVYGRSVTFETPDTPPLPTFDTGTHLLRFVLTSPENIPVPEAIYFVSSEEFAKTYALRLLSPEDQSEIGYEPPSFTWEKAEEASVYLIEFYGKGTDKPLFSAYTKNTEYTIPVRVFERIFQPGERYRWQVKGFGESDVLMGESPIWASSFGKTRTYLPGQILVVTSDPSSDNVIKMLTDKYSLTLLRTFNIRTLNYRVDILKTEEEIQDVIKRISGEKGVIEVQPNYIFRTLSEPMSDLQRIRKILNLDSLHNHNQLRGKDVLVAVIDTGVDPDHGDLKKNIKITKNFVPESGYMAEIHGTAMAGIIAAEINGFGIEGIAPEAGILALRACRQVSETSSMGECYSSTVAEAIDTAIQSGAKVVNLSIGTTVPDTLVVSVLEEGTERGVIFIAPAGNRPFQTGLVFPASHPSVVAVCGLDSKGKFYPNESVAENSDVCAPSENILTTVPSNGHNFLSGTSMSSAVVAGIITVAAGKNRDLTRSDLPPLQKDLCKWQESLLNMTICK